MSLLSGLAAAVREGGCLILGADEAADLGGFSPMAGVSGAYAASANARAAA